MSPARVLCVCLAAVLLPAVLTKKNAMSRHQLELREHYKHLEMIAEFECDQPQQRLLSVNELLSEDQLIGKAYFPEVTVLNTCDRHVGSCSDASYRCGPTSAVEVKMPFKVTFLEAMDGREVGSWMMEYHTLQNHTACGCLKYEGPPPSKTTVHYHYVDPSLAQNMPPGSLPLPPLPLDPSSQTHHGNASSYDVPVYRANNTRPSGNETEESGVDNEPSVYNGTRLSEGGSDNVSEQPSDTQSLESQFPGYPTSHSSETPVGDLDVSTSTTTSSAPSDTDETTDADLIPNELIRFGGGDSEESTSPRSGALRTSERVYDHYLKHANS